MDKKRIAFIKRIFGLIIFACFLIIFFCPTSHAKDLVNIDLVGAWGNSGDIKCVQVYQDNNHKRYAYCGTSKGLLIMDTTDRNSLKEITFFEFGAVYDIDFNHSDNKAFRYAVLAAWEKGVIILDISDPTRPIFASQLDTAGHAHNVTVSGKYAFVADLDNGLVIIDCSDPSGPMFAGNLDTKGHACGVAISGNYAFVADWDNGLVIIDCSDPSAPVFTGGFDTEGSAMNVFISGNYAFVADLDNGLVIIDCSDPSAPVFAGDFNIKGYALDVAISGNYAFVAGLDKGLLIIDCSDPSGPIFAGNFNTGGDTRSVAIYDNYAFVACGSNGLVIIDCADPSGPIFEGDLDTKGHALDVEISGTYALVADEEKGLVIIDCSNPSNPVLAGDFDTEGDAFDVAISGNYAFVADRFNGIEIIDWSNPSDPVFTGGFDTEGSATGVKISGKYAFVADGNNGLIIIDWSNPSDPVFTGGFDTEGFATGVAISGNYAFVADWEYGLLIFDISDPSDPIFTGDFDTEGYAWDVAISGSYAFVADYDNGLVIIDCSDLSAPVLAGDFNTSGYAKGVAISGNYAFVADGPNSILIFDISNPSYPILTGDFDTEGEAWDVAISGSYAFVADYDKGLVIFDCSDPSGPVFIVGFNSAEDARGVRISGNYAYVADGNRGLVIIDCSDPSDPVFELEIYTGADVEDVAIDGNYAIIANGYYGLHIFDISNPSRPIYTSWVNTDGYTEGVAVSGNYAFVADGYNGLVIIDCSNLSAPVFSGEFDTDGYTEDVAVSGNYAFVADGYNGLLIIDCSNLSAPVFSGGFDTDGHVEGVAVSGNYAFVADGYNGLLIIDCSNLSAPVFSGEFDTDGHAEGVAVSGNYAFVADGYNGLLIAHIVYTKQPQGNLIICPSGPATLSNPLWPSSHTFSNRAYSIFLEKTYSFYFIYYLNSNPHSDINGLINPLAVDDFLPTTKVLVNAITDWAYNRLNTGPLFLYLPGQGMQDAYQIMPGEILKASSPADPNNTTSLKRALDIFQEGTNRDIICLFEFASSGSFCDDLIDTNTLPYCRTIITCTDSGTSYLDQSGQKSFTGQLLNLMQDTNYTDPGIFEETGISFEQRVKLLQGLFSHTRKAFWSQGHPFSTQPPQMVTAQGPHTLCAITLSADKQSSTIPDPNILAITSPEQTISLNAIGHYLDGSLPLDPNHLHFQSSAPSILLVTPEAEAYPNPNTAFNGKATILATIIDPNFTQPPDRDPDLLCSNPNHPCLGGVTGRITVTVDIPTEKFPAWKEKDNLPLAIIVAGEKEKQDYLWCDTHTISHYAYRTLLSRGYSRSRIKFLTHLQEELLLDRNPENDHDTDLDGDKDPNNDIDGIPSMENLENAILWAKDKGTNSLTLLFANHGTLLEDPNKCGFYLNPDEILTPLDLDLWLDDLQIQNPNLKITIIIEACHSGLFIGPLEGENRIILTSTREGESYIYAQGLVSFSYYLLTYLQSGANLASAYDSALFSMLDIDRFLHENRQYLNEPHQRPQLYNRSLARDTSLGGSSLISQDQPVVTSVHLLPDPNSILVGETLTIRTRASDLDGIDPNGVWALINATYSPPVFSGDPERPIVDLPRIELKPQGDGIYEGSYDGFIYPGPYSILVFARDKKTNVSLPYSASLNVEGEVQDRALLVAGWDPDPYRFSKLLNHAQWVLEQKRLSHIEPPLISPSLNTLEDTLYAISEDAHQIFVYLIGQTEKDANDITVFRLNAMQVLHPDTLNDWLDNLSAPRQVVLIDAPGSEAFFREGPNRIYLWSSSSGQSAFLEQGGYCAFSHFFFTSLYSGLSVFQAYNSSCWAMQYYSGQIPGLEDGHWDQLALATYLGSPFEIKIAGTRITVPHDRTVWGLETIWADTNVTNPNVWVLIKTPQNETISKDLLPANDRYETKFFFDSQGTYTVIFYVEDPNGLINYDTTTYTQTGIDPYEDDDSPDQATPFLVNNTKFPQLHNLHDPTDEDWVIFHAFPDRDYSIWVEKKGIWKNCDLKAAVYSLDANQVLPVLGNDDLSLVLEFKGNSGLKMDRILPGTLPRPGFYLLKFHYGCPQIPEGADTLYEISEITDGRAGQTGIISGHVRDNKYHSGIAGAEIMVKCQKGNCSLQPVEEIRNGNTGLFYLLDYMEGYYQITATATGYQKSIATYVPVTKNTITSFTIELTPTPQDPNEFDPNRYIDIMTLYQTLVRRSYDEWKKEYIVTLYSGMNLLSFPCLPKECDSNCFLQDMEKVLDTYSREKGLLYDSNLSIHRYDSQDKHWQVSFMDTNQSAQGDIFNLDPYEGYLVYIQFLDPNYVIKNINIPLTYAPIDANEAGYDFSPPIHLSGFLEPPPGYTPKSLLEDPMLKDSLEAILHHNPENGAFSTDYRFFKRPCGSPGQIVDDKGYLLFIKEEIHDWQPK